MVTRWLYPRRTVTHTCPVCFPDGTAQIDYLSAQTCRCSMVYRLHCVLSASHGHLPQLKQMQHSFQISHLHSCLVFAFIRGGGLFSCVHSSMNLQLENMHRVELNKHTPSRACSKRPNPKPKPCTSLSRCVIELQLHPSKEQGHFQHYYQHHHDHDHQPPNGIIVKKDARCACPLHLPFQNKIQTRSFLNH